VERPPFAPPLPGSPSASALRWLGALAVGAVVLHVLARFWLASEGRFFATEDDGYRAYYGHLVAEGTGSVLGRFWLPGQFFVLGALGRAGLDAALAPQVLGAITFVITLVAVYSLARDLAPEGWGEAAGRGAVAVAGCSPLLLVLSHSALAEPLANALVAFAAAALARRHRVGPRRLVWSGSLAMLLATWVRYETWAYALAFVLAAIVLARRREGRRVALGDGAVACLTLLGPVSWLVAQHVEHGDPFAFLRTIDEMASTLSGEASRERVAVARFEALTLWAGLAVIASSTALLLASRHLRALLPVSLVAAVGLPGLVLQIATGKGLAVFMIAGREVEFFEPRLVSNLEVGLFPLAGVGLSMLLARPETGARLALAGLASIALALGARGVLEPMSYVDASSVAAGLALRRGELEAVLGDGALLVERVEPRPPMGWASLSVQWSSWNRTVFFTRRGESCELVEASDVVGGRLRLPCGELSRWAEHRGVTAAWVLSEPASALFDAEWPAAPYRRIGTGRLVSLVEAR
jgi:hypothetical protein